MAYLAIDNDGQEVLFASCPKYNKDEGCWIAKDGKVAELPKGSIERLLGEPMEINDLREI